MSEAVPFSLCFDTYTGVLCRLAETWPQSRGKAMSGRRWALYGGVAGLGAAYYLFSRQVLTLPLLAIYIFSLMPITPATMLMRDTCDAVCRRLKPHLLPHHQQAHPPTRRRRTWQMQIGRWTPPAGGPSKWLTRSLSLTTPTASGEPWSTSGMKAVLEFNGSGA